LYGGKLYLQVLQRDVPAWGYGRPAGQNQSYLLALEPATGKELWKVRRPSKAYAESREAFSSPVPFELAGRKELLVVGGDALSGHDPETGKELWRWGTWNPQRIGHWRLVPSPVGSPEVILACAPKGEPIYAVKTGQKGTLDDDAILWTSEDTREITSDVPTPAYYDGDFFVLSKGRHCLSRVDPKTGNAKWTVATPTRQSTYEASPLAADGKIYLINFEGLVAIFNAADGKIINQISMADERGSRVRSSISASGGNLFVRTDDKLYCIGK
jgi:outer membrane protein assembly factor BamB